MYKALYKQQSFGAAVLRNRIEPSVYLTILSAT